MNPSLSIITIVFNGEELIEGTIQSVIRQSYPNIEYIIVDGKSKDMTMDIVEKYRNEIDIVISEPDDGLYDAMNKGLEMASSDYVWFMNCGDHIPDENTVEKIFEHKKDADIYYGECMFVNDAREHLGLRSKMTPHQLPTVLKWQDMSKGMVVSHQSFIMKRSIAKKYIDNNLCADIDWVIDGLKKANLIVNTNLILSEFLVGGLSKQRHKESLRDRYNVLAEHFGFIPNLFNHFYIVLRAIFFK